ncbi:MAG: hypothetical protein LBQ55_04645 [Treponema sp.]|jgi:hypothetical protein|nr:hypothetical protein [Treponema sp.]
MAIQPIDLQTLFTQLDKVGKSQAFQKEGLAAQQAIQQAESQKKTEARIQSVNEAQSTGEDGKINDQGAGKKERPPGEAGDKDKKGKDGAEEDDGKPAFIRDPALGRNIDIEL